MSKLGVVLLYTRINLKIVFGLKALIILAVAFVYVVILCLIAVMTDALRLTGEEALLFVVWIPLTVFAVLFSMDIISKERDANLIETFFTVSVSVYRLWLLKFMTLMASLTLLAFLLIVGTDIIIVDLPIWIALVNVLPPVLFFASLTVLFSSLLNSANAAAMCVTAILAFVMLTYEGLATTPIYPFLNPLEKPLQVEAFIWVRNAVWNKILYTLFGCVWFWLALKRLDRRERMLK